MRNKLCHKNGRSLSLKEGSFNRKNNIFTAYWWSGSQDVNICILINNLNESFKLIIFKLCIKICQFFHIIMKICFTFWFKCVLLMFANFNFSIPNMVTSAKSWHALPLLSLMTSTEHMKNLEEAWASCAMFIACDKRKLHQYYYIESTAWKHGEYPGQLCT